VRGQSDWICYKAGSGEFMMARHCGEQFHMRMSNGGVISGEWSGAHLGLCSPDGATINHKLFSGY